MVRPSLVAGHLLQLQLHWPILTRAGSPEKLTGLGWPSPPPFVYLARCVAADVHPQWTVRERRAR